MSSFLDVSSWKNLPEPAGQGRPGGTAWVEAGLAAAGRAQARAGLMCTEGGHRGAAATGTSLKPGEGHGPGAGDAEQKGKD